MPSYNFRNTETGEVTEEWMSISQREEFLKANKNLEPYIDSPAVFSYSTIGDTLGARTDNTWKEVMSKIAEAHPVSELAKRHSTNKSIKRIQSEQALAKYRTKQAQLQKDKQQKR
jgi:hypothetical protein